MLLLGCVFRFVLGYALGRYLIFIFADSLGDKEPSACFNKEPSAGFEKEPPSRFDFLN
jgi:hypothetical protein